MYVEFIVQKSVLNRRQKHLKQQAAGIYVYRDASLAVEWCHKKWSVAHQKYKILKTLKRDLNSFLDSVPVTSAGRLFHRKVALYWRERLASSVRKSYVWKL